MSQAELFYLETEDGTEVPFEEVMTIDSEDYGKSYIVLAPVERSEAEEVELLAFTYDKTVDEGMFQDIETQEELDMIQEVLATSF